MQYHHFPNYGYISHKFEEQELESLKKEIEIIKNNFEVSKKFNSSLAGVIKKEYVLSESKKDIENLLLPFVAEYGVKENYFKNFNILSKDLPLYLDSLWVNFQEKHEFNPNHTHDGVLSFVIWIKIPYLIGDEKLISPGKYGNHNVAGEFEFRYINSLGNISGHSVPADASMENIVLIFPSKMVHCVYPFYSSDDYRISVSGNFKLKVD